MGHSHDNLTSRRLQDRLADVSRALRAPAAAALIGFVLAGVLIFLSGGKPFSSALQLIAGGYSSPFYLTTTLTRAIPIVFAGLASSLAWGSGYETMGVSGQMTLGALAAAVAGASFPGPPWLAVFFSLLAGIAAGVAWSLLAAWISASFDAYLLIVTLMLNYIAENIASYLASYVFRDPAASDNLIIQTQRLEGAELARLMPDYTLHTGIFVALACVLLVLLLTTRTSFGYEASMNGLNPLFARYGGIDGRRAMVRVLALSGAIAGLGGAVEVLGVRHQFVDKMISSPGYAWSGITAAILSDNHPMGILFCSVFLAGLSTGGGIIERSMRIPQEISSIVQGVLTIFVTARFVRRRRLPALRDRKGGNADAAKR